MGGREGGQISVFPRPLSLSNPPPPFSLAIGCAVFIWGLPLRPDWRSLIYKSGGARSRAAPRAPPPPGPGSAPLQHPTPSCNMSYGSDLRFPASSYSKKPMLGESSSRLSSGGRSLLFGPSRGAPSLLGGLPHPARGGSGPRSSYSSSYRRLPAPSSSLDHLEVLLSAAGAAAPSSALSNELKIVRTNEKEQLQGLNDRFVTYIEKVHQLEQHNRLLEGEVAALRQRQTEPSRLQQLYEQEIRELRSKVEALRHDGDQAALESQQLARALQRLRDEAAHEAQRREEAEAALREARKEADRAALARLDLEKKVEALLDEIAFLRHVHDEEVAELQAELQEAQVGGRAREGDAPPPPMLVLSK